MNQKKWMLVSAGLFALVLLGFLSVLLPDGMAGVMDLQDFATGVLCGLFVWIFLSRKAFRSRQQQRILVLAIVLVLLAGSAAFVMGV